MISPSQIERSQKIIFASWLGIILNAVLATAKITLGLVDNSFAVVSDGVDSGVDILTSLITLFAARLMMRPPDKNFPYGYSRVDPLATKVLSFFIFFAGIQLVIAAGKNFFEFLGPGSNAAAGRLPSTPSLLVTGISIAVKTFLAHYKISLGKKLESSMLHADGKNMRLDIVSSIVVLLSLIIVQLTGILIIDAITGIIISIWIIWTAVSIFIETNIELMDGMPDTLIYGQIIEMIKPVRGVHNPHRLRVKKLGHLLLIVMDIEVEPETSIAQAHELSLEVERLIRSKVHNVYDIIIHVEPLGLKEDDEKFGISGDNWEAATQNKKE